MTLADLLEEVFARGFTDWEEPEDKRARVVRWINQSIREITDQARWPFLEATETGTAPFVLEDLGHVVALSDESNSPIPFIEVAALVNDGADLGEEGTAQFWYRQGESTINVYPVDTTTTFTVRYLKVVDELGDDGDEPPIPAGYRDLIIDGAVFRAYKATDNFGAAQEVKAAWEIGMRSMRHALLKPNYDRERLIVRTGSSADYLG